MFLVRKKRVVSAALPVHICDLPGTRWWLREEGLAEVARQVAEMAAIPRGSSDRHIRIIKGNDRKTVFRIHQSGRALVAKVFHLNRIRHRLKFRRFGLDEAANLIMASGRGLNVPRVEGYGQVREGIGLIKKSIVLTQELEGFTPVSELLERFGGDKRLCTQVLMRTAALFSDLYRSRCNHIDVNSGAVMMEEEGRDNGKVFILDFQHARFLNAPSTEVLMAEAGRFISSLRDHVPEDAVFQWLNEIFARVGISTAEERLRLMERFRYYRDSGLSRKERKRIS